MTQYNKNSKQMDVIHNTTITTFSFIDRMKILIGGKAVTNIDIETYNLEVHIKHTKSRTSVTLPGWITALNRKPRGQGELMSCNDSGPVSSGLPCTFKDNPPRVEPL